MTSKQQMHSTVQWKQAASFYFIFFTSQQVEVVRVEQLEAEESQDNLEGEGATVDKVSIEQLHRVVKVL